MAGTSPLVTGSFWRQAAERAAKTAAQTLVVVWGGLDGLLDVFAIDWSSGIGVAVGGALLSLVTSVASAPVGDNGSPSLVAVEPDAPTVDPYAG